MFHRMAPKVPPELERRIFLLAFQADWVANKGLLLVAKRVHQWLLPKLYEVVIIHTRKRGDGRHWSKPWTLAAHGGHTRHLMHYMKHYSYSAMECLSWCPNVINVALWTETTIYDKKLLKMLQGLQHLTYLSFDFTKFRHAAYDHPPFELRGVTHLEVIDQLPSSQFSRFEVIDLLPSIPLSEVKQYFPAVTHFSFCNDVKNPVRVVTEALDCWQEQIKAIIMYLDAPRTSDEPCVVPTSNWIELNSEELRVVVIDCGRSMIDFWYGGTRGGQSIWKIADETIEARQLS